MALNNQVIPTRYKTVLFHALRAYADCNSAWMRHNAFGKQGGGSLAIQPSAGEVRNLSFRSAHSVSAEQFVQLVTACIGGEGYNNFTVEVAARVAALAPTARYIFGREGSPCVYLKIAEPELVALFNARAHLKIDEFGRRTGKLRDENNLLRLWWSWADIIAPQFSGNVKK